MTDIIFGNNNRPVLKLLAKRSLKAQKNTIAVTGRQGKESAV